MRDVTSIVYVILIAFVLTVTISITSVLATHDSGVVEYEWHMWGRDSKDGHLNYLNCDENNDYCALKIKTTGPIQGMSQAIINDEVDTIEVYFDGLGKKMSIDRVTSANSYITAYNLPAGTPGEAV